MCSFISDTPNSSDRHRLKLIVPVFLYLSALCLPVTVAAQTVYRHVDEHGVVTFSDVATDGAEAMELEVAAVREEALSEQRALIDQQLAVAKALEESRLAREDARTRRLEAQAASEPKTVYYREADRTRYIGGPWLGGWPGYPGHPGKPVHPIEPPPEQAPSRPVPLPPLNGYSRANSSSPRSIRIWPVLPTKFRATPVPCPWRIRTRRMVVSGSTPT
jgi:hypothetical protein